MALSDRLTKLAEQAKKIEDEAGKARDEARGELEAHVRQASEAASRKAQQLSEHREETKEKASDKWTQVRSDWANHVAQVRQDIATQEAKADAANAEFTAELAEADAYDAIDFASAALEEAEYAVLDAILARKEADEREVRSRQDMAKCPLSYPPVPGRLQVGCRHVGQSDRGRRPCANDRHPLASPQCQACRRPRGWLLASLSYVDTMPLAVSRTSKTGRRGLIGAWHRPH